MKQLFLPALAIAFVFGASSCAKCVTCKNGDQWQKFCDKSSSKEDIDDAIKSLEALGWDCKESSKVY